MRKLSKTTLLYGVALTFMATNLYAQDYGQSPDARPPQMAPASPSNLSSGAGTTRVLGTLTPNDMASPQAMPSDADLADGEKLPQPKQVGNITYITGGFGDEERNMLQAAQKDYNLRVMEANKQGQFVGDNHIVIRTRAGDQILDVMAGPLFYAQLPAGSYTLEISNEGQTKTQNVVIGKSKPSYVHISW